MQTSAPLAQPMIEGSAAYFDYTPGYERLLHEVGLANLDAVFNHPQIVVWRSIPERENCTLDAKLAEGRKIRLHIKRFKRHSPSSRWLRLWIPGMPVQPHPAEQEAAGIRLLLRAKIPTVPLIAVGKLEDGRGFVITEDLAGYEAADQLLKTGFPFDRLLTATATLAAQLHNSGLHHRDLYLNHFFVNAANDVVDLRLIDAARVQRLPTGFFRQRWIIKDLAQFWYSTFAQAPGITDQQRHAWLTRYVEERKLNDIDALRQSIESKCRRIARHDAKLNRKQPNRNVAINDRTQY